jgi:hypothetical protein
MLKRVEEHSALPEVLKPAPPMQVESKPMKGLESVTVHKVFRERKLLGKVWVYDEGMRRTGFADTASGFPLGLSGLVGEEGTRMLDSLSSERLLIGESTLVSVGEDGLDDGALRRYHRVGAGTSLSGREWYAHDESFRKSSLVWADAKGGRRWVDVKIPGQELGHYNVEPVNFFAAVKIYNEFLKAGRTPPMASPLMLVNLPSDIPQRLYGQERTQHAAQGLFSSGVQPLHYFERPDREPPGKPFSSNYMVLEHLDGMRLVRRGKGMKPERDILPFEYVRKVSKATGKPVGEIVQEAAGAPFTVTAFAHKAGYFLEDDRHHGNYILCTDGVTRSASDFGGASELRSPFLAEMDVESLIVNLLIFSSKLPEASRPNALMALMNYDWDPVDLHSAYSTASRIYENTVVASGRPGSGSAQ